MRAALLSLSLLPLPALAGPAAMPQPDSPASRMPGGILTQTSAQTGLDQWIVAFRPRALAAGIAPATLDLAFQGIRYNDSVIEKDRNQAEFTRTIWDYLDSAVSDLRVENGTAALRQHRRTLDRLEAVYGVPAEVVTAIWGLESSYGANRGDIPVIESLATLAHDGRRGPFFEAQLIDALRILQSGDVVPEAFTGSWAGAMGHTQFIPSSFHSFAVDFDGDGRRDIWSDDPTDALASTAAYLAKSGWQPGLPWGIEVTLPPGFDYGLSGKGVATPIADWAALGVTRADGSALPDIGSAELLLPAGARGAAFLITANFRAIERYNAADAYVIAVGHLSDRLAGGPPIQAAWPREDRALTGEERRELQQRLTAAGFDTKGVDGKIGPNTLAALRAFQRSIGMVPDGYASLDILKRLR
ncbi:lytic murein transglycosylase [Tabrizicola sp. TH137]|uniref:lytic murein transglycosylase n=1 Tax=Tabrizicola sp. TH137 TaxID=2067452 RepID=UPI000C7BC014|nr:lytic murein transglycosylase [Tabrizicola sp. TH137]PLL14266.1 lytic murein transglycosylase [Tabrizicola sp. TH137]